jgi:hypothetical protein
LPSAPSLRFQAVIDWVKAARSRKASLGVTPTPPVKLDFTSGVLALRELAQTIINWRANPAAYTLGPRSKASSGRRLPEELPFGLEDRVTASGREARLRVASGRTGVRPTETPKVAGSVCPLNVDSSRPVSANSGHSLTVWRNGA